MLQVLLGIVPVILLIAMTAVLKARNRPTLTDIDSVEVYRGPSQAALVAVDSLSEAGIAAWIEHDDGSEAIVHVDAEAADQLPTLMRVAQAMRAGEPVG
jgi:hypothetical protein